MLHLKELRCDWLPVSYLGSMNNSKDMEDYSVTFIHLSDNEVKSSEDINVGDHFDDGPLYNEYGYEYPSIHYTNNFNIHKDFNPVTHFKVEGDVIANTIAPIPSSYKTCWSGKATNVWTHKNESLVVTKPDFTFHFTFKHDSTTYGHNHFNGTYGMYHREYLGQFVCPDNTVQEFWGCYHGYASWYHGDDSKSLRAFYGPSWLYFTVYSTGPKNYTCRWNQRCYYKTLRLDGQALFGKSLPADTPNAEIISKCSIFAEGLANGGMVTLLKKNNVWPTSTGFKSKLISSSSSCSKISEYIGHYFAGAGGSRRDLSMLFQYNWRKLYKELRPKTPTGMWNSLSYSALQDIGGLSSNMVAYIKEATEAYETVARYYNTIVRLRKSKVLKKAKYIASAYLGIHYGFKLTYLDTKETAEYLRSQCLQIGLSRAQATEQVTDDHPIDEYILGSVTDYRYQIFYDTSRNLIESLNGLLRAIDLKIDISNTWDMIPFSFVVDWFTGWGDFFEALDNLYSVRSYYTTAAAGQSKRTVWNINSDAFQLSDLDTLSCSLYQRMYKKRIEDPVPSNVTRNPLKHWIEGAALIVSNR